MNPDVAGLAGAQHDWTRDRLTVLEGLLPRTHALGMAARLEVLARGALAGNTVPGIHVRAEHEDGDRAVEGDAGGEYRHVQFDRYAVNGCAPELVGLYYGLGLSLEAITGRPVRTSPWERSSVNAKVLLNPGDGQGWHTDTNTLTVLVYLTDTHHDTATEFLRDRAEPGRLLARAGDVLVMDGTSHVHRVPPHPGGLRVTAPLNYYFADAPIERPEGLDRLVYGS